jgi:hypothetical protein
VVGRDKSSGPSAPRVVIAAVTQRCGSTWIQRIVHASSDLFMWGESYPLVPLLCDAYEKFAATEPVRSAERAAFFGSGQDPRTWVANLSPPLDAMQAGMASFLASLYGNHGKAGFGWKEVSYERRELHFLWRLFPELRFVLLVRNPHAVIRSLRACGWIGRWPFTRDVETVCRTWARRAIDFRGLSDDPRVLLLRYEEVRKRLDELLVFVGGRRGKRLDDALAARTGETLDGPPHGAEDAATVEAICGDAMRALGYQSERR